MSYLRVSKVKYGLAAILCVIEIAHRRRSARQRLAWHLTAMLIVGLSVSVSPVLAQVTTGDILGTVADQTGAIVPNASVTAVNEANGTTRMTQTGTNGEFTFNLLDPGMYTITVKVAGFKETQVTHVELSLGARARVDAVLQAGQVSESVTVEGNQRAALQTDSSTVDSVVSTQQLQDVPLNGRNFINLVTLQPGVNSGNPKAITGGALPDDRRQSSTVQANDAAGTFNNQMVDGLDNNERQQGFIGIRPSIDSIAEMQVLTNNYSAQFGRTAGAVVNIITKSGGNQFHGSAFEFFRNDVLDSRDFFADAGSVSKPELRQNQFGFSIGGPIFKNKTFFFGAMEWFRQIAGQTDTSTVPTSYEQANPGDFSDIHGYYGGVVPAGMLSPAALNYFKLYPAPNQAGQVATDGSGVTLNNFIFSPRRTQFGVTSDVRIDHTFNPTNSLFGHYAYNPVSTVAPAELPPAQAFGQTVYSSGVGCFICEFGHLDGPSKTTAQAIALDYVHIFSPNLLLDLKAGFTRINIQSLPFNYGSNLASKFGIQNANLGTTDTSGLPTILFFSGPYAELGDGNFVPEFNTNNVFQGNAQVTYTRGPHSLKAGGSFIRRDLFFFQDDLSPQGGFLFFPFVGPFPNPMANFLAGVASADQRGNDLVHPRYLQYEPSLFAQDDWRVTKKLTLNLGVRWEVFTPMTESHNYYSNFDPATLTVLVAGKDTSSNLGVRTQYHNFSPRLGAAMSVSANTVVRGGFGMSYFPSDYAGAQQNQNPPFEYTCFPCNFGNAGFPSVPLPTLSSVANPSGSLNYRPPSFGPAHVIQYNLGVQQQFGLNVITATYVGQIGRSLGWGKGLNQPLPPGAYQPEPAYIYAAQLPNVTGITEATALGYDNYNALITSYQRHVSNGLTVNVNYTWSRGLGNDGGVPSDPGLVSNDPHYDYGNSQLDFRHHLAAIATYKLPFGNNLTGVVGVLGKGWSTNLLGYWQTGYTDTVEDSLTQGSGPTACNGQPCPNPGSAYINLPGLNTDRPNMTGKPGLSNPNIAEWFNTSVFTPQIPGTAGSERVNQIYGPHDRRVDLSLFKQAVIRERVALEFRAECFNISNTPNFDLPDVTLGDPGFGRITDTNPQELPRQWQFGLKVKF